MYVERVGWMEVDLKNKNLGGGALPLVFKLANVPLASAVQ